jgi:hypothetical protein
VRVVEQWLRLLATARERLRTPLRWRLRDGNGRLVRARCVVRSIVLPSFTDARALELVIAEDGEHASAHLGRHVHALTIDGPKLGDPVARLAHLRGVEPTMRCDSGPVALDAARQIEAACCAMRVPLDAGEHCQGLDGTNYELQVGDARCGQSLRWWERPPPAWSELGELVRRLDDLAASCPHWLLAEDAASPVRVESRA